MSTTPTQGMSTKLRVYSDQKRFFETYELENHVIDQYFKIAYLLEEGKFPQRILQADNVDEIDSWPALLAYILKLL